jgi:uncharacterized membrane-anchored protein
MASTPQTAVRIRAQATTRRAVSAWPGCSTRFEVTLYFWIIKILATTVGETAADFLIRISASA